ncbi:MAG TPA: hypothetical protein P5519_04125 [Spirochaetia bacterium]|nr:hypothetical protein [Spirochaetales bacterium]HPD80423.1 hypothetical protein [Spirochaetales bacterium]HRS65058.1 hypothetical protein [Spirochaetia bacterium]
MSKISANSFGKVLLQISLAVILFLSGLSIFIDGSRNEVISTIGTIFANSTVRNIIAYSIAIIELLAGALLVLDFFSMQSLERTINFALIIIIIIWMIFMVIADVFPLANSRIVFIQWLYKLAQHMLVLAGLIIVKAKA